MCPISEKYLIKKIQHDFIRGDDFKIFYGLELEKIYFYSRNYFLMYFSLTLFFIKIFL